MDMPEKQLSIIELIQTVCKDNKVFLAPMNFAKDIMTRDPKSLTMDNTIRQALKFIEDQKIRHLAVFDAQENREKPRFIGIVSQRDLLRVATRARTTQTKPQIDQNSMRQLLSKVVTRRPTSVAPETTIQDLISIMLKKHFNMVPVLQDDKLIGIITSIDIVKLFVKLYNALRMLTAKGAKKTKIIMDIEPDRMIDVFSLVYQSVEEVMTADPICMSPQDDLEKAIQTMRDGNFRHLPLIDEEGKLTALVSDRDILGAIPFGGMGIAATSKNFRDRLFKISPKNKRSLKIPLKYVMTQKFRRITPAETVYEAATIMRKEKIGALPVIDIEQNFLGMLTIFDLMKVLLRSYESPQQTDTSDDHSKL